MKNELLDLYNRHLVIAPDMSKYGIGYVENNYQDFLHSSSSEGNLSIVKCAIKKSEEDIARSIGVGDNTVSGKRFLISEHKFLLSFCSYFPWEVALFSMNSPIVLLACLDILEKEYNCDIRRIHEVFPEHKDAWKDVIRPKLKDMLVEQELWAFNMGSPWNKTRTRPVKRRHLTVTDVEISEKYSSSYGYCYGLQNAISLTTKDVDTGQVIYPEPGFGWNLYLSEDLMNQRLTDIKNFWMRGYDEEIKNIDNRITSIRKELVTLKEKRRRMMGSIEEYKEELDKVLFGA